MGAFAACMAGLTAVDGPGIIERRLAGGRPVLGICVGMQVLFELGVEWGERTAGCGRWPGTVERLKADVLPHMGWNTVRAPSGSALFAGLDADTRFYFVHSFGVRRWELELAESIRAAAGHLGAPRRGLRGRGGERLAGRHPVPPGEVRRRRGDAAAQLAARRGRLIAA